MPEDRHITRDDLWAEVNGVKSDVSDLKSGLSGLTSEVHALAKVLQQNRPQPTNWTAIGAIIISMIAIGAQGVQYSIRPLDANIDTIREVNDRQTDMILGLIEKAHDEGLDDAESHGSLASDLAYLKEISKTLIEQQIIDVEERGRSRASDDLLNNWLNKVDNIGPRAHIPPVRHD